MSRFIGLLCLISVAIATHSDAADPARLERLRQRLASGALQWGGDAEGSAPYQLRDPRDPARVIGFEVEIADEIAASLSRQLGVTIRAEFVQYEWVSLVPGLGKKDFDVILAGLEVNPENREKVKFSRPYYLYAQQLVVRKDEDRIQSLADCRGHAVATLSGSAAENLLRQAGIDRIVGFDGQVEPYFDLEKGRVDAVLLDVPIYTFYAATNPELKPVGSRFGQGEYAVGLRQEDDDLRLAIDEALSEMMQSGKLRDILRRWHLFNSDQKGLAQGEVSAAELAGLGFDPTGEPLDESLLPPVEYVNRDVLAAAAEQWTIGRYGPLLLNAAGMTILLTVTSMLLAVTLGLAVALCRLYGAPPLRILALAYVEFFRGVPLLLVLFFLYFGVAPLLKFQVGDLSLEFNAVATAILAFGLTYAAYESEIYRSAIESIPRGQWEAGRALGMTESSVFRRVVFPQALRTALGPMTNDFVALFKDTSLVSVIAVRELTKEYLVLSRSSLKFVELGILTALLYLVMSAPLGYLSRELEKRWGPKR